MVYGFIAAGWVALGLYAFQVEDLVNYSKDPLQILFAGIIVGAWSTFLAIYLVRQVFKDMEKAKLAENAQ